MFCRCAIRFGIFHFFLSGQMRVEKRRFFFFGNVCHLNYIYIFRRRQLILQDMIRHVLQMCSKDFILPLGSYEGRTMTLSVIQYKACHLNSIYISNRRQMILQDMIGYVLQMYIKVFEFLFSSLGSNNGRKMTSLFRVLLIELHV